MALPDGRQVVNKANGDFDFPAGTVLVKSFRLGGQLIETRLLMRHPDTGWAGYTYEWNDAQTTATRVNGGAPGPSGARVGGTGRAGGVAGTAGVAGVVAV